jgi:HEAT repeat protein
MAMSWPMSQDYNEAIQAPARSFADPDLRRGQAAVNALRLPMPCSGNFADVYQICCPEGSRWAVKCFTREVPGLRERYREISRHLGQAQLPFIMNFTFLEEGIRVGGRWFPVVKMEWVEGLPLNQFVARYAHRPKVLEALLLVWARMANSLRAAEVAHGDLQHGNVLLVPGPTVNSLALKLVDYDGMWVPALAGCPSGEVGHPAYQHPQRLRYQVYGPTVDCFPLLLVATALSALRAKGRALWEANDDGDNLLFRRQDLEAPATSVLFNELLKMDDLAARHLVAKLREAAEEQLDRVPLLEDALFESTWEQMLERQRLELLPWAPEAAPEASASTPVLLDHYGAPAHLPPPASEPERLATEQIPADWPWFSSPPPCSSSADTAPTARTATTAATKPRSVQERLPLSKPFAAPPGWTSSDQDHEKCNSAQNLPATAGSPSAREKSKGHVRLPAVWAGATAVLVALAVAGAFLLAVWRHNNATFDSAGIASPPPIGDETGAAAQPPAPKSVADLIKELQTGNRAVRWQAAEALGQHGPTASGAYPELVRALADVDARVRDAARAALTKLGEPRADAEPGLVDALMHPSPVVSEFAFEALAKMGLDADHEAQIYADVLKGDRAPAVRVRAVEALGRLSPKSHTVAVPALLKAQKDADANVAGVAREALPHDVPTLVRIVRNAAADLEVRLWATDALGKLGSGAAKAVPDLADVLTDQRSDLSLRRTAVAALAEMGPAAAEGIKALVDTARDRNGERGVRRSALEAIGKLGTAGKPALGSAAHLVSDRDPEIREAAWAALEQIDDAAARSTASDSLLSATDLEVRVDAAVFLGRMGAKAKANWQALTKALEDEIPRVRLKVAKALTQIDPQSPAPVPALATLLTERDATIRREARDALATLAASTGRGNASTVKAALREQMPVLEKALDDDDEWVRLRMAKMVLRIDPRAAAAVAPLAALLSSGDVEIRREASEALVTQGGGAKDAVPALRAVLKRKDEDKAVRRNAVSTLAAVDKAAEPAMEELVGALDDTDLRQEIIQVLGKFGANAIPALKNGLKTGGQVCLGAAQAVSKLGPLSVEDAGQLRIAIKNALNKKPVDNVRRALEAALRKVEANQ